MDDQVRRRLAEAAAEFGTPSYVYFVDTAIERVRAVRDAFGGRFEISYAIKSNPNAKLLEALSPAVHTVDASSGGEVQRALAAGVAPARITFSGPAKRDFELELAVASETGLIVCESASEMQRLNELAQRAGRRMCVAIRINPRTAPKKFGVSMAGKSSQFGIDEEDMPAVAPMIGTLKNLELTGFHIYSGTNSLSEEAIAENFQIFRDLFGRFAEMFAVHPATLIFGSGFGIPYHDDQRPLELTRLAALVNPMADALKQVPELSHSVCVLEMGRFLVGPAGYFLTRVVTQKRSRGTDICLVDGGFNNHLAAFGLMGTVIRRNWSMQNVSASASRPMKRYMIVGPLCTTIDTLAQDVDLETVEAGDVIAVGASGAYGVTASPVNFISHPAPREILARVAGGPMVDATEMYQQQPVDNFVRVWR